ncbi:MAG TPA: hypothetical protein VG847_15675 [Chitinophagaceae bacterium]|nr:hypothetical protein [Chitinophagaceae bacterium]
MKKIFFVLLSGLFAFTVTKVYGQGCVAIRTTGGSLCTMQHPDENESESKPDVWQLNIGNRYFNSFRHYIGTVQQKQRLEQHTEVINHVNTTDFSIARDLNRRLSLSIGFPILATSRSQRENFGSHSRFTTHSFGMGDLNVTLYRWMLDPLKSRKGNIQLGVGIKFATGADSYEDYFPVNDSTKQLRTVDQSIQLGDGGTGIIAEANGFYNFTSLVGVYGNLYYLINPREQNGVPTYRSNPNEAIMSVPDQYMARVGINYGFKGNLKNLSAALGGRLEGIPVYDLIGGSEGFRRPGYIIDVEPGLNLMVKKSTFFVEVPIALVRCRTQSVPDKETTRQTGVYTNGDAAFADYLVNVGFTTRF